MKQGKASLQCLVFLLVIGGSFWIPVPFSTGEDKMASLVEGFNVEFSADKDGNITYTKISGKAGVGTSEEEAKANLSPIQIAKTPSGKSVLFFEQKKPYRAQRRIYLDATSGLRLHPAMDLLFELGDLESKATSGERPSLEKLTGALSDESDIVRLYAAEAIGRVGGKTSIPIVKSALATGRNDQIKGMLEKSLRKLEGAKAK